jgi:cell division protein FtsQ
MTLGLTLTKRGRRVLRLVPGLLLLAALAAGGWLWLRDCGLVRVHDVTITGVTASDGAQVKAALTDAAQSMTTLHVRTRALEKAVAGYPSVRRVTAAAGFPHRLTIRVIEQRAVAALAANGGASRIPVTGSGIVLTGVTADRDLPSLAANAPAGARITDAKTLSALRIAGAAPEPLLHRTEELTFDPRGIVVSLSSGPQLVFGSAADARAKWTAAARVLADPSAQGAAYLDLRIPGRVAAGGLAPVTDSNAQVEPQNGSTLNQG